MDRIVQSYIEDFLKSQQISEKNQSKQFEMFASYCAIAQQYTEVFDLNDALTGASGDCGIDGIAIIANGTMVTSKEEVDDLIELNNGLTDILFIFIQAKTSSHFACGEMGDFGAGVIDFFSETPQFVRNSFIQEKNELVNYCQTAHCGRCKPRFVLGEFTSPIVPYRNLPQTPGGMTADCRSLV